MAITAFKGSPVQTIGDFPQVGESAPDFALVGADLSEITLADFSGKQIVLNIFPSIDTPVCAASVRHFNESATSLDDTVVVTASVDTPFALGRFCGAEGIENVTVGSAFRSSFGTDYGVTQIDGPLRGVFARAILVIDPEGKVVHSQVVPDITQEPDYDAALSALS